MRSAVLSAVRQMTSSRQSPWMSPEGPGGDFVELLDERADGESNAVRVLVSQFHFEMVVPSSSSRRRSPSHQTAKFVKLGLVVAIATPAAGLRAPGGPGRSQ